MTDEQCRSCRHSLTVEHDGEIIRCCDLVDDPRRPYIMRPTTVCPCHEGKGADGEVIE